jgi:hypothetical protein
MGFDLYIKKRYFTSNPHTSDIYCLHVGERELLYLEAKNIRADCTTIKFGRMYLDDTYNKIINTRYPYDSWFKK